MPQLLFRVVSVSSPQETYCPLCEPAAARMLKEPEEVQPYHCRKRKTIATRRSLNLNDGGHLMTELQARYLEMLKQFDQLCRDNEVEYYLVGGTLMGALRHKGYIPWDDDVDIHMTREQWEKFYTRTKGRLPENIAIDSQYDEDSPAQHVINLYIDTSGSSIYRYNLPSMKRAGLVIDIFILDPVPDDEVAMREYERAVYTNAELTISAFLYALRMGESTHYTRYRNLSRLVGTKKTVDYIGRKAFHHTEEESRYYASRFGSAPHFWTKETFGKPKYVPFEDTMLPIPARPEDYLVINYDEDWMYLPRGSSKSTHGFCVRSTTIPAAVILDEYKKHIDRDRLEKLYLKRKKMRVAQSENWLKKEAEENSFIAAKVKLDYEKKLAGVDLQALLDAKDYDALDELFNQYIDVQRTARFTGSFSLANSTDWYHKCHPTLIDIGDQAFHAVLDLLMHKQKLGWAVKFMRARKTVARALTEELQEMDGLIDAIKAATSAYNCGDDEQCRAIVAKWLPKHPENPFLWKLDLKERIRHGLSGRALIEAAQTGLELFPEDPELLYFQGKEYLTLEDDEQVLTSEELPTDDSEPALTDDEQIPEAPERPLTNMDRALAIFRWLIETTNHGLVLLNIRGHLEELLETEPLNETLLDLWLNVRKAQGEEGVPTLQKWLALNYPPSEDPAQAADEAMTTEQEEAIAQNLLDKTVTDELTEVVEGLPEGEVASEPEAPQITAEQNVPEQPVAADESAPGDMTGVEELRELTPEEAEALAAALEAARAEAEAAAEAERQERLTPVQLKRRQLLGELADICEKNSIRYFLIGKGLLQAARKGYYVDTHGELSVAMAPGECRKFIEAVQSNCPENRYLNSMDTNPMFHRFCIQYCASDSLDFSVSRSGCGDQFGIYITIEILRFPHQDKKKDQRELLLERGWEAMFEVKPASKDVIEARRVVAALCAVFGRARIAKWLFWRFMQGPKHAKRKEYYIKPFWGERTYYLAYLFKYKHTVKLEGTRVMTMKLYKQYLKKVYGAKWKTRKFPMTKAPGATRIIDANVTSKEYLSYLNKEGLDRKKHWKQRYSVVKKWAPTVAMSQEIEHYLDLLDLCGERYRLWEKYMPMREELLQLFKENKVTKLMKLLTDYYNTCVAFNKKGLGVCFDKKIFDILEHCLISQGKAEQAKQFRRHVPKADWKELPPPVPATPIDGEQSI